MKTKSPTIPRRFATAVNSLLATAVLPLAAFAQTPHAYLENSLPPPGGEFRGAAPAVFRSPTGGAIPIAVRSWGGVVEGSCTESALRGGGDFSKSVSCDGVVQPDPASPPVRFSGQAAVVLRSQPSPAPQPIPIEILSLEFQSSGPAAFRLRESPTLPSHGITIMETTPDGNMISSFFDVFTEMSLDGGQTWLPAVQSVRFELTPAVPEHFFPSDCFPLPGEYQSGTDGSVAFPNGIVIRNFRHRPSTLRQHPPDPGVQAIRSLGGTAEFDLSHDGGNSFQHYYVVILSDCLISGYSISSGGDRPMESLSLNFSAAGLNLPKVMIRESPTLASSGCITFRPVAGGGMVGSFFDIFTEVSLDEGETWVPADGPLHLMLLPYIEQENFFRSDAVLPRDGSLETWPRAEAVHFPNGMQCRNIRLEEFSRSEYPPNPCASRLMEEEGIFYYELSADRGQTWTQHSAPFSGAVQVLDNGIQPDPVLVLDNGFRSFDTEMLALNVGGPQLPGGMMIRESPTRQSHGRMAITSHPRIGQEVVVDFMVDSFFDVFTELSLDGGQSWLPALNAARLHLRADPPQVFQPSDWLPLMVQYRETDFNFACRYAGNDGAGAGGAAVRGIIVQGHEGIIVQGRAPLPAPGASLTRAMQVPVAFQLSQDNVNFTPQQAQAFFVITLTDVIVDSIQWSARTEVQQFEISGGTLPPGVMLRESPTRASTGRTSLRAVPGGFRCDSFFDVFTELSVDGGQTWMPSCDTFHIAAQETAPERAIPTNLMPPNGTLASPPGAMAIACATGQHIKEGRITRASAGGVAPPGQGQTARVSDDATAEFLYSEDGGKTFTPIRAQAYFRYEMENIMVSSFTVFDTEMLQLEVWGGNLPPGVMLRESPTRASTGRTSLRTAPDGTFRIGSFFDVFTELSVDSGRTWTPFDLPMRYVFTEILVTSHSADALWPPPGHFRLPPGDPDFDLLFVGGVHQSFFDVFYSDSGGIRTPLPDPYLSAISNWQALVQCTLFLPDGTPVRATVNASLGARFTSGPDIDGTRTFDTEMLQLDLAGGTLPPGMMLRESPTQASPGRTSLRSVPGGFMVDSFFDIFTEISLDGGQNWSPSDGPMRLEFAAPEISVEQPSGINLTDGADSATFAPVLTGEETTLKFTIRNTGPADLTGLEITFDGPDADAFSVAAPPAAPVPGPAGETSCTVRLSSATAGLKTAAMHIASNDSDESPFDITLYGRVLAPAADDDGDGVTNETELHLADCDFHPLTDDSAHILNLRDNGFYRASDMHSLALGNPVLSRDPVTGRFHFSVGVKKSSNLTEWSPLFEFTPTHDPATGLLDLDITAHPDGPQFFQLYNWVP